MMLVLLLHIIPTSTVNEVDLSSRTFLFIRADFLVHLLLFIPLMVLVWLYLNRENITGIKRINTALLWLLGGVLFAAFVEGLQFFLPYRSFNLVDMVFNVSGVIVGSVIFLWEPKRYAKLK